jgi:hypothetical protein
MIKNLILALFIPLLLISIWFGPKKNLAHAEEGLPYYNSFRTLKNFSTIWQDNSFGEVNPFVTSRITLYAFSSSLQILGFSALQIQVLIFYLIILVPLIFVPLLIKSLLTDTKESTHFIGGLFYVFNLFVLSQVLHRFVYELIFLWSYLPLFLYLWLSWLRSQKIKYLILFLLSSIVYSNIFVLVASIFSLWLPAGIIWLIDRKLAPALLAGILWITVSVWWWYPLVTVKDNPYLNLMSPSLNVTSLADVSKFYPNSEVLLLKQNYFFGVGSIWHTYFSLQPITYISYGILFLIAI